MSLIAQHVAHLLQAVNHLCCRTIVKESRVEEDNSLAGKRTMLLLCHLLWLSEKPSCASSSAKSRIRCDPLSTSLISLETCCGLTIIIESATSLCRDMEILNPWTSFMSRLVPTIVFSDRDRDTVIAIEPERFNVPTIRLVLSASRPACFHQSRTICLPGYPSKHPVGGNS